MAIETWTFVNGIDLILVEGNYYFVQHMMWHQNLTSV